jgi:hypothetical protein
LADKDNKKDQSRVIFGGTSLYASDLKWVPVVSKKHWMIEMKELELGSRKVNVQGNRLLLDTGSTFSFLPASDFQTIITEISKAEPRCRWKGKHFVCPGDGPAPSLYPIFKIKL